MSDTIRQDATYAPEWKRLYQAAMLELDPAKLPQRISEAHKAIVDRTESRFLKPSDSEQLALRRALEVLSTLRKMAEREVNGRADGTGKTAT